VNEPFGDQSLISSEDYLLIINRLNEFADNTFTFGESILKRMEESGLNSRLKLTMNKGAELGNNLMKKTRDGFTQINQNSKVNHFKEKATDKLSSLGGRFWGYLGYQDKKPQDQ